MTSPARPTLDPLQRRQRVIEALREAGGGVAIVPTAPEQRRNADSDYPFRHDSYFHYLTGFDEPGAWLVLHADGRSLLFCRPKDPERELWDGFRLGPEDAPGVLGLDAAWPLDQLDAQLPALLAGQPSVWTLFGVQPGLAARVDGWLAAVRARSRSGVQAPLAHRDLCPLLDEMRLVKDKAEQATMRRAARISAGAHMRAMRFAARRLREDPATPLAEYEVEAELLHEFRRHGAAGPAYTSIVAAGAHACVLHYEAAAGQLRPGELCLVDAGCELDGYASDITRTWPAGGRFDTPQRELYELVLAAQEAAIAVTRPGARKQDAHWAAARVISQGLLDLGLLSRERDGDLDAVIERAAYRRYFMHGTGHWLGRDVHDVGEYLSLGEAPAEESDGMGGRIVRRPSRRLLPGMVVTVEPGVYVRPAADVPERYWHLGVRIEDDALVTAEGCELLSRDAPVTVAEIEALMREG